MITVTPSAMKKIKEAMAAEGKPSANLRVYVEGGGCSGLQYGLAFEEGEQEGDASFPYEGFKIMIDRFSLPYLQNVSIDYKNTLQGAGFRIENPMATGTCSCGQSFKV